MKGLIVTHEYLDQHPECIFVFGDNLLRKGKGGAAALRDHPQTYGFITKKSPSTRSDAYYTVDEYKLVFQQECDKFIKFVTDNKDKVFLVSKIGGQLANKYHIYELVIEPVITKWVDEYPNIKLVY